MLLSTNQWQDLCKFFSGGFFMSGIFALLMYFGNVTVYVFGTIISEEALGLRALIHSSLFIVFFYLGFFRTSKPLT